MSYLALFPSYCRIADRVSNTVFAEAEKPGNLFFFKTGKPVLAACKPGFAVLNFDLQCLIMRPTNSK